MQSEPGGVLEDSAFASPGGEVSDEAKLKLSVEARAELDELFSKEIEMNPEEVPQSSGDGFGRPASGQQGFEEPPNKLRNETWFLMRNLWLSLSGPLSQSLVREV